MPEPSEALALTVNGIPGYPSDVTTTRDAGHVRTGGPASLTVTLNVQIDVKLLLSFAAQPTYVVPIVKLRGLVTLHPRKASPEASEPVGVNATFIEGVPCDVVSDCESGQVMDGTTVSVMLTWKKHWVERPALSVALQLT